MTRFPKPTEADLAIIGAILSRLTFSKKSIPVFAKGDFATGGHLSKKYTGWMPTGCCTSELRLLHDKLRTLAGYTYARKPLNADRIEARKLVCHQCPAYHPNTDSCGRLILDAISPHPVNIDGQDVNPCGCVISLKAIFRSEQCPASRWP